MYNLIFFLPKFSFNGAGKSTFRLCKNLDKKKYNISLISLGKNSYKSKLNKIGCKVYEVNSNTVFFSMFKIHNLVKKIVNQKYKKNIFLSAHHYANVSSIIFLRSIKNLKIIGIERSDISELLWFHNFFKYLKNILILLLVKIFYKKANVIISNSESGKKDLIKMTKAKVLTIHSPSFSRYYPKRKKNFKELKIISIGRLVKEKGYETILEALTLIKTKKFKYHILGDGPERNNLNKIIERYGLKKNVYLLGFQNPKKYLMKSNLFINASFFEGFPNAIVEAINSCLPSICSNCKGGTREILLNGKGGYLFETNNPKDLSKKINLFYKKPRLLENKMLIARKKISKFSEISHTKKYEDIFNKI
tara:strand:- start:4738 stop:5826 length:1089 start_codon:yes stop_codon:yes gene_type:complete